MKSLEKDKRVRKTKTAFREALRTLLSQKELRNITVKELCELADVNRGTFYSHYTEVHDIIDEMHGEVESFLTDMFEQAKSGLETKDAVSKHLQQTIYHIAQNKDMCAIFFPKCPNDDFHLRLSIVIEKYLLNAYQLNSTSQKRIVENMYSFLSGGCMGILKRWVHNGMVDTPEEIAEVARVFISNTLSMHIKG